jgi:hypothetical protein
VDDIAICLNNLLNNNNNELGIDTNISPIQNLNGGTLNPNQLKTIPLNNTVGPKTILYLLKNYAPTPTILSLS